MTCQTSLAGWGNTSRSLTTFIECSGAEAKGVLRDAGKLIPRGLGRGYGDCAVLGGGTTLRLRPTSRIVISEGRAMVEGGVSLDELLTECIPLGLFLPVTPGTRFVTVGGAIAADVHGKNHHCDGTFGSHVEEIDLLTPSGDEVSLDPSDDLFWATVGGMGLTGVILRATIRLIKVETSYIRETSRRFKNLEELMLAMESADKTNKYSVAWVDTLSRGKHLGRSVLSLGDHASRSDLPRRYRREPLGYSSSPGISLPGLCHRMQIGARMAKLFNEAWYRKPSSSRRLRIVKLSSFFYPLDRIANWNIFYGRSGFVQHQFVVPDSASHVIVDAVEIMSKHKIPAYLSVLKRFGPANKGMLSFPLAGWTLATDIPATFPELSLVLDQLDEMVAASGGRVYLAKDARLNSALVRRMYPELQEFSAYRRSIDPQLMMDSNLARRLFCD